MWIPAAVTFGFDPVLHPNSLIPSVIVGVLGLVASVWLYIKALRSTDESAEHWRKNLQGGSLTTAELALQEIEQAKIQ